MADVHQSKSRDEEFYYLLTEGSEHLQGGRIDEARVHFERALQIHPANEQALNLLGLSLFRLGHLDRARQIFHELVHGNPVEPSLRLNLAMVFLKQSRLEDAHRELEHVLDLNPDHPRASSYMGLVLEKKGQLERAADFYERAGNKKRADEIRAFTPTKTGTFPIPNLAAMGVQPAPTSVAPGPAAMRSASPAPATAPATNPAPAATSTAPATSTSPKTVTMTMGAVQVTAQGQVVPVTSQPPRPPPVPPATMPPVPATTMPPVPATTMPPSAAPPAPPAPAAQAPWSAVPGPTAVAPGSVAATSPRAESARFGTAAAAASLAATSPRAESARFGTAAAAGSVSPLASGPGGFAAAGPATSPGTGVLEVALTDLPGRAVDGRGLARTADGALTFPIVEHGYVRSDLLTAIGGSLEVEAVHRRYRGKRTDSLFGGTDAAVVALAGRGFAVLALGELLATSVQINAEELYLVESAVVGFSNGLVWENGRLPSETDRDLDIVHLRGAGRVVLGTKKPVVAFNVRNDAPCVLHASRLIGWSGQLIPFRAPLPGLPEAARRVPIVRFEGTGLVLAA
jgi:hypothetical protein